VIKINSHNHLKCGHEIFQFFLFFLKMNDENKKKTKQLCVGVFSLSPVKEKEVISVFEHLT